MSTETRSRRFPSRKNWKFFVAFFAVAGTAAISVEYVLTYSAVQSIQIASPKQLQRELAIICAFGSCYVDKLRLYFVPGGIVSGIFPEDLTSSLTGLRYNYCCNWTLTIDSVDFGPAQYGSFDNPVWETGNRNDAFAINQTGTHTFTLTMAEQFSTNVGNMLISRSITRTCVSGYLVGPTTTCTVQ